MPREDDELADSSEEEEDDFDPEAGKAGGGESDEEEEEEQAPKKGGGRKKGAGGGKGGKKRGEKGGKRSRNIFIDDAAEEDDDEDEEDEDRGRKSKKKRSRYIDDMAAEDRDADEEEEEEEEDFNDLIAADNEAEPAGREGHGNYQRVTELRRKETELTDEELEEFVRQKYESRTFQPVPEDRETDVGLVGQQGLLPGKSDARLWAVQCRPGSEREVVICLLQRASQAAQKGERLGVKSAFSHDHIKGYVWVEAHKLDSVRDGLRGLRAIFHSKTPKQVPLAEMVEAITVPRPETELLEPNSWAEVRNGPYKGDLARVVDVDHSSGRATIEVVPRIDYTTLNQPKQPFGRGPKIRPPPRAFNPGEARDAGALVERENKRTLDGSIFYVLDGKMRFRSGYLQRTVAIRSLKRLTELPPLETLQRYKQAAQSVGETDGTPGDLSSLMESLAEGDAPKATFAKGDRVDVVTGDLQGMSGRVERVGENNTVVIMPFLKGMDEAIEVEASDIVKSFKEGNHVKVLAGQLSGETGMVTFVKDGIVGVYLDGSRKEARLFARDLTLSADIVQGLDRLGPYEQHDLVSLDAATVGVIVECQPDSCKILTNKGTPDRPDIRTARLPDIKKKIQNSRNIVTNDLGLNPVSVGDMVDVKRGSMSDKAGTVKYIFRGFLFLQSREVKTYGGFFCVSARDTRVRGAKQSNFANPNRTPGSVSEILAGLRSPGPSRTPGMLGSPRLGAAGQSQSLTGASGGGFSGRSSGPRRDDGLVGRTLNIARGPNRGYKGRVLSATETHCRIELEATYKAITVKRTDLKLEDGGGPGRTPAASPWGESPTTPMHPGGRTPMHSGSATPMHAWGGSTPLHPGSMTPSRMPMTPGRETPGHNSAWAPMQTPLRPSDAPATPGTWGPDYATPGGSFGGTPQTDYSTGFGRSPAPYTPGGTPATGTPAAYTPDAGTPAVQYSPTQHGAGTPGGGTPYSPTANHGAGTPYTPGGMAATPGTPGGGYAWNPATDSAAAAAPGEAAIWQDVHITLPDGRSGVVRQCSADGTATVQLGETTPEGRLRLLQPEQTATTAIADLALVPPRKKDAVRVVHTAEGADRGSFAELAQIDNMEGVIRLNGQEADIKIVSLSALGRIVQPGEA